jgi:hemoglobin
MRASLYERIGGEAAVNAAVEVFYRKVLGDYRINRFFGNTC